MRGREVKRSAFAVAILAFMVFMTGLPVAYIFLVLQPVDFWQTLAAIFASLVLAFVFFVGGLLILQEVL